MPVRKGYVSSIHMPSDPRDYDAISCRIEYIGIPFICGERPGRFQQLFQPQPAQIHIEDIAVRRLGVCTLEVMGYLIRFDKYILYFDMRSSRISPMFCRRKGLVPILG